MANWEEETLIMKTIYEFEESKPRSPEVDRGEIVQKVNMPEEKVGLVLERLEKAGYLKGTSVMERIRGPLLAIRLTEKGLQQVAGWPSSNENVATKQFIAAIDKQIKEAKEPGEKKKWQSFKDSALDVSTDLLAKIIAELVRPV